MKNPEHSFEYLKESVRLTDAEKAHGRAELSALMQERPMRVPVRSPLSSSFSSFFASPFLRIGAAALVLVILSGGGIAYAANDAKPSDALYAMKVKVNEPVQIALTFDDKTRADLEVGFVNERLKEVAEASVDSMLTPNQVELVTDSLSAQIDNAQDDIATLSKSEQPGDTADAVSSANDLAATLSAHAAILGRVQAVNPAASSTVAEIVDTVSDQLEETSALVDTAQDAAADDAATTTVDDSAETTNDALEHVKQEVQAALNSFDTSDRADVDSALADIQDTIATAQQKDAAGDHAAAYLLYADADQRLTSLKLTIEADQTLHIDVIDTSTTGPVDDGS